MKFIFVLLFAVHAPSKPVERQVLLFYKLTGKEIWEKQRAEFAIREPGIKERDILVKSFNIASTNVAVLKEWKIDPTKFFTFILVGRDGSEKFRSVKFVPADQLFAIIDAMPMRKDELRKSVNK